MMLWLLSLACADPPSCPQTVPAPYDADPRAKSGSLIVVYKQAFSLGLYQDGQLVQRDDGPACFPIAMGDTPQGPKTRADGSSTPEGWYHIAEKRDVGQTRYYRGFLIDYPNAADVDRALAQGVISSATASQLRASVQQGRLPSQHTAMGGLILIHGWGAWPQNWTLGCVGVENATMDYLFPLMSSRDDVLFVPWSSEVKNP